MNKQKKSRREFMKKSAVAAAAFTIVPGFVLERQGYLVPVII